MVTGRDGARAPILAVKNADTRSHERALQYMGLKAGTRIVDIPVDRVFIGSCTNSRPTTSVPPHLIAGKHVAKASSRH